MPTHSILPPDLLSIKRRKRRTLILRLTPVALVLLAAMVFLFPAYRERLLWRWMTGTTYLRGVLNPIGDLPTPKPSPASPATATEVFVVVTPTREGPSTPTVVELVETPALPTNLPESVALQAPPYESQGINNCGPASLSMAMHMLGWQGDQYEIAHILKPVPQDRNVNPEEMAFYVRNYAGWMNVQYRVNGSLPLLKTLIAEGYPVIVEEAYLSDISYYPNDDLWTAHYLLLTGYDDAAQVFTAQDSYYGADRRVTYANLVPAWEPFNFLYMVLYLPEGEGRLKEILGSDWEEEANRQNALAASRQITVEQPKNAFAWFNYGNNLVYFGQYEEAAHAFDQARTIGLPQRMLRYQFTPFLAYFHALRTDDLAAISKYALGITPTSEEAMLWMGWALYRQGQSSEAIDLWEKALHAHPGYADAEYAIQFAQENP